MAGGLVFGALAYSVAGIMTTSMLAGGITVAEGALITGVEFAIAGFGAGLGGGWAQTGKFSKGLEAGGWGALSGFAVGAVVGATYTAGIQNVVHGMDTQQVNSLYDQAKNALASGDLAAYADAAMKLSEMGVSIPTPNSILGVYRDPNIKGIYANNPIIYQKANTDFNPMIGLTDEGNPLLGSLKTAATGEALGGAKIVVYGIKETMQPTSWIVYTRGVTGGVASTGWETYGWVPVSEKNTRNLSVTYDAERYFRSR